MSDPTGICGIGARPMRGECDENKIEIFGLAVQD
jgi:hypothetical protein